MMTMAQIQTTESNCLSKFKTGSGSSCAPVILTSRARRMDISKWFIKGSCVQTGDDYNDLSPRWTCLVGSLLVQYYLEKWSEGPVDGNRVNISGLTSLIIDQFPSFSTCVALFALCFLAISGGSAVEVSSRRSRSKQ
jgi:hypothetical protein